MPKVSQGTGTSQARVLRLLWKNPGISRIEIARRSALDKSTVTSLISELIASGLVRELEAGESSPNGGRRPVSLEIAADFGYVIGIDMQPKKWRAVAVNLAGEVLHTIAGEHFCSGGTLVRDLLNVYTHSRKAFDPLGRRLIGCGLGVSGLVDTREGVLLYSSPLETSGPVPVAQALTEHIDVPFLMENDANCGAWGELAFHKNQNLSDFLFCLVELGPKLSNGELSGIGIGMGLSIGGKVHHGRDFSAGEYTSVLWKAGTEDQTLPAQEIMRHPANTTALRQISEELAASLSFLVNALNLSHVFFGGDGGRMDPFLTSATENALRRNRMYPNSRIVQVLPSSSKDSSVAFGAAGMLLDRLIDSHVFPVPNATPHWGRALMHPRE